jgi:tRNA A37 methylthiotransferase MiaB
VKYQISISHYRGEMNRNRFLIGIVMNRRHANGFLSVTFGYSKLVVLTSELCGLLQGDRKVSVHLTITVQKTRKNILNSFNHLT